MATVFERMMLDYNSFVKEITENQDGILLAKMNFIKQLLEEIEPAMNAEYWERFAKGDRAQRN